MLTKSGMGWTCCLLAATAAHAGGELDATFGDGGRMLYAIASRDPAQTPGALAWAQVSPLKVLPLGDGRSIVLANAATPYDVPISTESVPVAVRIGADGSWDTSYGIGGRALVYVGEDYDWRASDAVLLPDGRVVVVGTIDNPDGSSDMAVWALAPGGEPDTTFGVGGLTRLHRGGVPSDAGKAIALLDVDLAGTGSASTVLVVAGNIRDGLAGPHTLGAAILSLDGYLCPSGLAGCGNVVGGAGDGYSGEWRMLRIDTDLCPNDADIDVADLTGFAAGVSTAIPIAIRGCGDTGVIKHTRIGNFGGAWAWGASGAYGNQSRSLIGFGPGLAVEVNAIASAPTSGDAGNESIVVAGFVANADRSFPAILAARVTRDAITTATYGMEIPGDPWQSPGAYAGAIVVQADGKAVLGGGYAAGDWTYGDAMLMRVNADLTPDDSFGSLAASLPGRMGYGYTIGGSDRDNRADTLALTPDGKLLFAGYAYASDDGQSRYGSVMRVLQQGDRIFANAFDGSP
ncbi:hypothetical protein [Dokdonella sp.]|uniref:hypothetical protein n=1 Tax=Dokdonella sp. TaxID=2291710 RepID=UPI002F42296C